MIVCFKNSFYEFGSALFAFAFDTSKIITNAWFSMKN